MAERDEEQARRKNAVVAALSLQWGEVNRLLFRGVMRPPTMALAPLESMLGRWIAGPRLMEFSEAFVAAAPWGEVFEVLKHEMAHQFVSEVLGVKDETAHGAAFQKVCADRGIDARAAGRPEEPAAEHEQRLVDRVRRLLSLAESPNLHEAEAAARMARRLIVKHNMEQEALHQTSDYTWRHLGRPSRRVGSHVKQLAGILASRFFVACILVEVVDPRSGPSGRVVEVCGTRANVAIAEFVFEYLLATAERLWQQALASGELGGGAARASFLLGIMAGFGETLRRQDAELPEERAMVSLRDKEPERLLRRRYPLQRSTGGSRAGSSEAFEAGREQGRQIRLRKPMTSDRGNGGGLLGSS